MIKNLALTCALFLSFPGLSQAKMVDAGCDDSHRLEQTLTQTLGATRAGSGLRDPETVLEIWVMETNGDWMVVQSYANGTSCVVAIGEHWHAKNANPA